MGTTNRISLASRGRFLTFLLGTVLMGLLLATGLLGICLPGCGSSAPEVPDTGLPLLTVREALAAAEGAKVQVQGMLVVKGDRGVLATALLESYPPQAGGDVLPLEGLSTEQLVGLSSTKGRGNAEPVIWSDYPIVLSGTIRASALVVSAYPAVTESSLDVGQGGRVRVRFSVAPEPLAAKGTVWWVFDVANLTPNSLDLVFANGQRGEVVLRAGGEETYRWSKDKLFTEAVQVVPVLPGESLPVVLNDLLSLEPGDYDLEAQVTATVAFNKASTLPLPKLSRKLTLH